MKTDSEWYVAYRCDCGFYFVEDLPQKLLKMDYQEKSPDLQDISIAPSHRKKFGHDFEVCYNCKKRRSYNLTQPRYRVLIGSKIKNRGFWKRFTMQCMDRHYQELKLMAVKNEQRTSSAVYC